MKAQRKSIVVALSISVVLLVALLALSAPAVSADLFSRFQPTPAPTATPGMAPLSPTAIPLPLDQALTTKEQALAQALIIDANMATWDEPWALTTLNTEPDRISIDAFKSRIEESAASGYNEWFAPEVEANAGAVWRIAIKGDVRLRLLGLGSEAANKVYSGVTYVISQRTGRLLSVSGGLPKNGQ